MTGFRAIPLMADAYARRPPCAGRGCSGDRYRTTALGRVRQVEMIPSNVGSVHRELPLGRSLPTVDPNARHPRVNDSSPDRQPVNQGLMSETECLPNSVFITQGTADQIWGDEMAPRLVARMIEA